MTPTVVHYAPRTVWTALGDRPFTDISVEYRGVVYGSRHVGYFDKMEAEIEAKLVAARVDKGRL